MSKIQNEIKLNESKYVLPDPPGSKEIYKTNVENRTKFNNIYTEAINKAKRDAVDIMIENLKKDLIEKTISIQDENGRQKILEVSDVVRGTSGGDFYPVIVEIDENGTKKSVRYYWESERGAIFQIDRYLNFFEKNYLGKLLSFAGKPVKGGDIIQYVKTIVRIGIYNGAVSDNILVEDDEGKQRILMFTQPIKIMDEKVKEIDPYAEENWDD